MAHEQHFPTGTPVRALHGQQGATKGIVEGFDSYANTYAVRVTGGTDAMGRPATVGTLMNCRAYLVAA